MDGLIDYGSSSSSETNVENKTLKPAPTTPCEESEVSSSVIEDDHKEKINWPTQNPATVLLEMGCSFEQILHAISLCGQDAQVEDLFDFIQACECLLEEDKNAKKLPVHEENGQMKKMNGSHTAEASCSRSPHVEDRSMSTLQELEAMGFSQTEVQRASDECNSIDFDVLLNFLLDNKEVEPHINDLTVPEVDSSQDEERESAVSKLSNMGFPFTSIKKALAMCGSDNFEELLDFLSAFESLKDEIEVTAPEEFTPTHQRGSGGASLFNDAILTAAERSFSRKSGVQEESVGVSLFNNRISFTGDCSPSFKTGASKWTKSMERLWCSYMGSKKKSDLSAFSDSDDDSETEIRPPTWEEQNPKSKGRKRKLEFQEHKEVDKLRPQMGKMMGYGIPGLFIGRPKPLPYLMHGPPYFYFENVASVPNNEWDTIKRHFNFVDPEFTDSRFFSASSRPRGYVHNIPVEGRTALLSPPPMTIAEALPETQQYWPCWDTREKLSCINTRKAPDSLCHLIRTLFALFKGEELPYHRKQEIVHVCKKWNLVWVGPGQAAPLEPNEIELLQGFDRDHTRGCSSMTERYDALGNSFQVHTVAYHLSPLKALYPNGITVLSLFAGIGGAEVALHKLGVHLKVVIAVEINEKVRGVLASWWRKSGQRGELKLRSDVRDLSHDVLADLVDEVGPIDLIIGGSPCNNLSGNNRVSRVGLSGSESSLFFEFPRILNIVTQVMRDRGLV